MIKLMCGHKANPHDEITEIFSTPYYEKHGQERKIGEACLACGTTQSINKRLSSQWPKETSN